MPLRCHHGLCKHKCFFQLVFILIHVGDVTARQSVATRQLLVSDGLAGATLVPIAMDGPQSTVRCSVSHVLCSLSKHSINIKRIPRDAKESPRNACFSCVIAVPPCVFYRLSPFWPCTPISRTMEIDSVSEDVVCSCPRQVRSAGIGVSSAFMVRFRRSSSTLAEAAFGVDRNSATRLKTISGYEDYKNVRTVC